MTIHGGSFLLVDEVGKARRMDDSGEVAGALFNFQLGLRQDGNSGRWNSHAESMRRLDAWAGNMSANRQDASPAMGSLFRPQDLTHRMRRVMEEALPPLNSREVFTVNTEVQPGSKTYEQSRFYGAGKAVVYRGGNGKDIPDVGLAMSTYQAPIVYLVAAASIDLLEEMSANRVGGIDINGRKMARARRALMELENRWTWEGSEANGVLGLLNHPYIDTAVSQVEYVPATSNTDVLQDLYTWADYASNASGGTFMSDTLLISNKLYNYLSGRIVADTNGSNVLEMFQRHKPAIKTIKAVRELDDVGGAGVHAMSFMKSGTGVSASAEIISAMEPTMLPAERGALGSKIYMLAGFGGLNATEVGSMVIVYVNGGS